MNKGFFICLEGLDGSGKTTHSKKLVQNLKNEGFEAIYTTEPSRGELGTFIREIVLEGKKRIPKVLEAILFAIDRVEHLEKDVKPLLNERKIVVSDRSVYSSLAYQGSTELDIDWIKEINRFAISPDLGIYIDVPPEIAVKRIRRKKSVMERLETQKKVREVYMKFVKNGELKTINGNRFKAEVKQSILNLVLKTLKKSNNVINQVIY